MSGLLSLLLCAGHRGTRGIFVIGYRQPQNKNSSDRLQTSSEVPGL